MKTFFNMTGSKIKIKDKIVARIPECDVYFDPFVGTGSVFLELRPKKAKINDVNKDIISCWRAIKDDVERVISLILGHVENDTEKYYYELRERDRAQNYALVDDATRCARFLYLLSRCHSGLVRYNKKGFFNAAYGEKRVQLKEEYFNNLREVSEYLNSIEIEIENKDVFDFLKQPIKRTDFIYLDPPYCVPFGETPSNIFTTTKFDYMKHVQLAAYLYLLREQGKKFLLSNNDCDASKRIYKDFSFEGIVKQRVGKNMKSWQYCKEFLITP